MDLWHLIGPSKGITLFAAVGSSWWTLGMSQQQEASNIPATESGGGSPVVDPLVRRTTNLTISDRLGIPNTHEDPPSPTSDIKNPNPSGSGSSSPPPSLSPHGNWVIRQVIWLPSLTRTQPASDHPDAITERCNEFDSACRIGWGGEEDGRSFIEAMKDGGSVGSSKGRRTPNLMR
jgi:hypothetical protein